jgi:hypothetical protein
VFLKTLQGNCAIFDIISVVVKGAPVIGSALQYKKPVPDFRQFWPVVHPIDMDIQMVIL